MIRFTTRWALVALVCLVSVGSLSGAGATARPEEVGVSSERLQQVNALMKRHLDAGSFAGAVTLVARNGRIVHLQPHGMADLESKQPMKADSMFRIMSMTKPVVGVAILMMMEEGKVRLNDPVSKFIPALKGLQVAVAQPAQGPPPPAGTPADPRYYTVPADHEITVRELLTHTSGLASGTMSNSANRKVSLKGGESLSDYIPRLAQTPLETILDAGWDETARRLDGSDPAFEPETLEPVRLELVEQRSARGLWFEAPALRGADGQLKASDLGQPLRDRRLGGEEDLARPQHRYLVRQCLKPFRSAILGRGELTRGEVE